MNTNSRSVHDSALNRQLQVLREVLATQHPDPEMVEALERLAHNLMERSRRLRRLGQMLKGEASADATDGTTEVASPADIKASVERSDEELLRELPALIQRLRARDA